MCPDYVSNLHYMTLHSFSTSNTGNSNHVVITVHGLCTSSCIQLEPPFPTICLIWSHFIQTSAGMHLIREILPDHPVQNSTLQSFLSPFLSAVPPPPTPNDNTFSGGFHDQQFIC